MMEMLWNLQEGIRLHYLPGGLLHLFIRISMCPKKSRLFREFP